MQSHLWHSKSGMRTDDGEKCSFSNKCRLCSGVTRKLEYQFIIDVDSN